MTSGNSQHFPTGGGYKAASEYPWGEYFPHDALPYFNQIAGIREFRRAVNDHGYFVMEGPCGSGKTTISLTGALSSVSSEFCDASKVAVVTPLTSQREQFVGELQTLNEKRGNADGLLSKVTAVEVGNKHEYLPYARENIGLYANDDVDDYEVSGDIKSRTDSLLEYNNGFNIPVSNYREEDTVTCNNGACSRTAPKDIEYCSKHAHQNTIEEVGKSAVRARAILRQLENVHDSTESLLIDVGGERYPTPYPAEIPNASAVAALNEDVTDGGIDPFRIGYYAQAEGQTFDELHTNSIATIESVVKAAATEGICPYRTLYDILCSDDMEDPQVVIGNYHHILNPKTKFLFHNYRGDETLLVVDEAHSLPDKARNLLQKSKTPSSLSGTETEWNTFRTALQKPTETANNMEELLAVNGFERRTALRDIQDFFEEVQKAIVDVVETFVEGEFKDVIPGQIDEVPYQRKVSLAEIGSSTDPVTEAIEDVAAGNELWEDVLDNLVDISRMLEEFHELTVFDDDEYSMTAAAARYLHTWVSGADRETYLREVIVSKRENPGVNVVTEVSQAYTVSLNLYSAIPSDELYRQVFSEYGGGILMSATLEPLEQFTTEMGLEKVEEDGRPVVTEAYDPQFPSENRLSLFVPAGAYTYSNRGSATIVDEEKTGTRRYYEGALEEVAQTYGNHLFCLPSAAEARCMAVMLENSENVRKEVFLDQPGERVLSEFKQHDEWGVLVTYMKGTLTTGVDYSGEDLHTAVVVGIPYPPRDDRRNAIETVYGEKFDDGWRAGVTAPVVRETRQAIGRVIRGSDEAGVRIFMDTRYFDDLDVYQCFPQYLQGDLEKCERENLRQRINGFWSLV